MPEPRILGKSDNSSCCIDHLDRKCSRRSGPYQVPIKPLPSTALVHRAVGSGRFRRRTSVVVYWNILARHVRNIVTHEQPFHLRSAGINHIDLDARSDVYSIGSLLVHCEAQKIQIISHSEESGWSHHRCDAGTISGLRVGPVAGVELRQFVRLSIVQRESHRTVLLRIPLLPNDDTFSKRNGSDRRHQSRFTAYRVFGALCKNLSKGKVRVLTMSALHICFMNKRIIFKSQRRKAIKRRFSSTYHWALQVNFLQQP